MEWNTKWAWESQEIFGSKATSPNKLQSTNWGFRDGDEDIDGSFHLSCVVGGSGGSASNVGNNSSAKSSISASTESLFKESFKVSKSSFGVFGDEVNETSTLLEASVSSGEPFIGLKLGKRTYFENSLTSSFSDIPISSVSAGKKTKSSSQATSVPRCQVEGCNLDLSSAKVYHRKHRVCGTHSRCPKVVVDGVERRFCQQCSRFHSLSEFDEKKRSCRRRLSDHNARRRKPQQETIRFNSTNLSSSFYGFKESLPPNVDALDLRHALSLLSNNSSGLHEPDLFGLDHAQPMLSDNNPTILQHPGLESVPQGLPLPSADYWQVEQHSINSHFHPIPTKTNNPVSNQFQEFQLFNHFYSNPMDEISKPM